MDETGKMYAKVVVSGENVEIYYYSCPINCNSKSHKKTEKIKTNECIEENEKRLDNLYRARLNVRRIVWSNFTKYSKFITLTYADTVLDKKKVKRDITTFVQAMRRKGYEMKYLYVMEHQKERGLKEGNKGSLHVHMLLFVDRFIPYDIVHDCWKHGMIDIKKIDDVKNMGAYVSKYITKDTVADFGNRCYSCSLGLERPQQERFYTLGYSDNNINVQPSDIIENIDVTYSSQFRHDFFNDRGEPATQTVKYIQGRLKDPLNEFKERLDKYESQR